MRRRDQSEKSEPASGFTGFLEAITSAVSAIAWPLIVVYVLVWLHGPLSDVAGQIPELLRNTQEVSAGGLRLLIKRSAQKAGNPELASLIGGLSRNAIELLLKTGRAGGESEGLIAWDSKTKPVTYFIPSPSDIEAYKELERKGLWTPGIPVENWYRNVQRELEFKKHAGGRDNFVAKGNRNDLDKAQFESLMNAARLSNLGVEALDLIIASVADEIKGTP